MKRFFLAVAVAMIFSCCCPCRKISQSVERKDSVLMVFRDSIIERVDTVLAELPVERVVNVTLDTVSRVETSAAVSVAEVSGGVLRHTLENTGPARVLVKTEYRTRDSIQYRDKVLREVSTVEVNRLTKWQKFKGKAFYVLLAALSLTLFFETKKRLKK